MLQSRFVMMKQIYMGDKGPCERATVLIHEINTAYLVP